MTENQDNRAPSSPDHDNALLSLRLPEIEDVEVFLVRLDDGTVVARTAGELEREGQEEAPEGGLGG